MAAASPSRIRVTIRAQSLTSKATGCPRSDPKVSSAGIDCDLINVGPNSVRRDPLRSVAEDVMEFCSEACKPPTPLRADDFGERTIGHRAMRPQARARADPGSGQPHKPGAGKSFALR